MIGRAKDWLRGIRRSVLHAEARRRGVTVSSSARLTPEARFLINRGAKVVLGDQFWLDGSCRIQAEDNAEIIVGPRVFFGDRIRLHALPGARIIIEQDCWFNHDVEIVARQEIRIGADGRFGPYCYVCDHNHQVARDKPVSAQGYDVEPILIGDDVWLGVGATILKGASLGTGAVIAARAVVSRPVPPYEIWGGNPARPMAERK